LETRHDGQPTRQLMNVEGSKTNQKTHWARTPPVNCGAVQVTTTRFLGSLLRWVAVVGPPQLTVWYPAPATTVPSGLLGDTTFLVCTMNPLNSNVELMLSMVKVIVSPGLIRFRDGTTLTGDGEVWGSPPWAGNIVVQTESGAPSGKAKAVAAKETSRRQVNLFIVAVLEEWREKFNRTFVLSLSITQQVGSYQNRRVCGKHLIRSER
jgi:hypothetical protein